MSAHPGLFCHYCCTAYATQATFKRHVINKHGRGLASRLGLLTPEEEAQRQSDEVIINCGREHPKDDRPKKGEEPMLRVHATYYGDAGHGPQASGQGWLALTWRKDQPQNVNVWGPFRTQSMAKLFGRTHFPRRYQVCGMHDPRKIDWYHH